MSIEKNEGMFSLIIPNSYFQPVFSGAYNYIPIYTFAISKSECFSILETQLHYMYERIPFVLNKIIHCDLLISYTFILITYSKLRFFDRMYFRLLM